MLAFTTNVEFGEDYDGCRCVYGRPAGAEKCGYLDARWQAVTGRVPHDDLRALLAEAVVLIGEGAERRGAERDVPLGVWCAERFQAWYRAQVAAGHALRGFQVRHALPAGLCHPATPLFGFLAWAAVEIAGEGRVKANEVFLARLDTVAVVPVFDAGGPEAEVFLAREYRLAVRNPSGFVVEVPGGSSPMAGRPPRAIALAELNEELGLAVEPSRLVDLGPQQSAPTLASHHTHTFALALTAEEAARLRRYAAEGRVLGEDGARRGARACGAAEAGRAARRRARLGEFGDAGGCGAGAGQALKSRGEILPDGAAFLVAVGGKNICGNVAMEAGADGVEFSEAAVITGVSYEFRGLSAVGSGLYSEGLVGGSSELGKVKARRFEVIVSKVQSHFSATGNFVNLGEIIGDLREITQDTTK
jgi:8-oxo-dGTP pyrophosphatase MutT (NUDIX family)